MNRLITVIKDKMTPFRLFVSNGAGSDEQHIKAIFVMASDLMLEAGIVVNSRYEWLVVSY